MIADFLFILFSATAVVSAVFVITRENPVACVMFLVVTLFSLAGLFVLLDAHFVAAVQVIVYAGAIMVLFLFVVMLLNLGHVRTAEFRGPAARMLAASFGVAFVAFVGRLLLAGGPTGSAGADNPIRRLLDAEGAVGAVALPLFRDYFVPFEVTSVLLLAAIVGAVVLARRREP
jgi:NADH-quinone oxidoreductase subunit J